ncbi:MAG: bifunctional DNA-formamidopyrimidine glycosylase/DNA-(apurinic or apyrimidinic site) lyase [Betaproteobacteria bacterium]|nr:bifunctional DNA-formamidopyrimidine glycosylase/DNA-(apurinic or apyrimidinic site) lyase [Betaproteobacteria bacterium]
MPELPEVEVVRQGLDAVLRGLRLLRTEVRVPKLRWEVDPQLDALTRNQMVCALDRRSKVLLVALERGTLLIHLGMSGSLRRIQQPEALRTHDHLIWHFSGGLELRLHDPRRFGSVLWFAHPCVGSADSDPARSIDAHFARLGPEPFDPAFNADSLHRRSQGRKVAVKQWLMSGTPVVGVGNIYASEALYRAGIDPRRAAGRIGRHRYARLVDAIREVLRQAIEAGGSTLRDFVGSHGDPGAFQQHYAVYGRDGEACPACGAKVRRTILGQRSSFWCPRCQR